MNPETERSKGPRFTPGDYQSFQHDKVVKTDAGFDLHYSLRGSKGVCLQFCETIAFESNFGDLTPGCAQAIERVALLLHQVSGVSYFKLAAPTQVTFSDPHDSGRREFLDRLYKLGLSEFAHVNDLDLGQLELSGEEHELALDDRSGVPLSLGLGKKVLLPFGGGKDSLLSLQLLTAAGFDVSLFVVGPNPVAEQLAQRTGYELIRAHRVLDPQLGNLNDSGAYNGHIPVTAIVSLIAILAALKGGFSAVVMSNEGSANVGSFVGTGQVEVNHQYSKSLVFEASLRDELLRVGLGELDYFSLLRPMSELMICRRFASLGKHLNGFVSCNKNFRRDAVGQKASWCLSCPKCLFVYLCLAPFLPTEVMDSIFEGNPLDREESLKVVSELLGVDGNERPFDCVGGPEECRLALALLTKKKETKSWFCVQHYRSHWAGGTPMGDESLMYELSLKHFIPQRFIKALDEVC